MSNYHWVCFRCCEAVRRPGSDDNVRCPICGKPCDNIGYKIPVPPKSKPQAWRELAESYAKARKDYFARKSAVNVRRLHDLEKELERIRGMEENDGRRSLIKKLQSEFASGRGRGEDCWPTRRSTFEVSFHPAPNAGAAPERPNQWLERTACERCWQVPSALRATTAGQP